MHLEFPPEWRFNPPPGIADMKHEAIAALASLAGRISAGGRSPKGILETFKKHFARTTGQTHSQSSSESWARSDLEQLMYMAGDNAATLIDAFWDACMELKQAGVGVPSGTIINNLLAENEVSLRIDAQEHRLLPVEIPPVVQTNDMTEDYSTPVSSVVPPPVAQPLSLSVQTPQPVTPTLPSDFFRPLQDELRVLFLAANPLSTAHIALDTEHREVTERVRMSAQRDQVNIVSRWAVRPRDLQQAILEVVPHIVHFSGHGSGLAGIRLQGPGSNTIEVTSEALSSLFQIVKEDVRAVVLNACYSEHQANAIAEHIDFVVGMKSSVTDVAACEFAAAFYQAIAYGKSIKTAFQLGVNAIQLEGLTGEEDIPVLHTRTGTADAILLRPR